MYTREEKIKKLLARNVEEVIERDHLEKTISSSKKLRVKLGIDPTSPDLHLGHAVLLRKLKEFQDLGHKIVLIIGDFTGRIGDPSGRIEERTPLTEKEIHTNMKEYLAQAGKIIDLKKAEIRYNSEWFRKEGMAKIVELASAGSIQQVLRRAEFKKRLDAGKDITLLETLYPLFQGYDSVMVKADVETGGTDQTFNLLMGRRVQRHFGVKEQDILTTPLLEGLDGVKKMSKSLANYIGLNESPDQMFGKIMSIPDALTRRYFMLSTDLDEKEILKLEKELKPRDLKARLGFEIVKMYHGEKKANAAEEKFIKVYSKKEIPDDIEIRDFSSNFEIQQGKRDGTIQKLGGISVVYLLVCKPHLLIESSSKARDLIVQGGVRINGEKITNPKTIVKSGDVIRAGRKFLFRAMF